MRVSSALGNDSGQARDFCVREEYDEHRRPLLGARPRHADTHANQSVLGFHSNRRVPERKQVAMFSDLYAKLLAEERRHTDWRAGMAEAAKILANTGASAGVSYEQFMFTV